MTSIDAEAEAEGRNSNNDGDAVNADVDDNPKRQLLTGSDSAATAASADSEAPAWRLKRLRPAYASIGILACFAACLTGCAPLVPDLLRELQPARRPTISRLLNTHGQCVATGNGSSSSAFHCTGAPPACADLPALCRFRAGLIACQAAAPACLVATLCLLALAVCAARNPAPRRRLLGAALGFACAGLAATLGQIACLHAAVADLSTLSSSASVAADTTYSADSTGARIAYAAACLQAVLVCQLACLPAGLRRVAADRAAMLARLLSD